MWQWIGLFLLGLLVVGLGLWTALVVAMRTKNAPALAAIRRLNHRITNPRVMKSAGTPGANASVIHHRGRSTGTAYSTPIGVEAAADGFVVTLPYGMSADWVKNVLAAGSAIVETEGSRYSVGEPRVVGPADVDRYFSGRDRLVHRLFGVDQFLVLERVGDSLTPRSQP